VQGVASTEPTILFKLKFMGSIALVFGRCIVAPFAFSATQGNNISHFSSQNNRLPVA